MKIKNVLPVLFAVTIIGLSLSLLACGKSPGHPSDLKSDSTNKHFAGIVHGTTVDLTDPLAQSIVALMIRNDQGKALCTGTLVDHDTVLTAAHCVDHHPVEIDIVFGHSVNDVETAEVRYGSVFAKNPRWEHPTEMGHGDLALIHFAEALPPDYEAAELADEKTDLSIGTKVIVSGYGVTNAGANTGSGELRRANTTILQRQSPTEVMTDGAQSSVCFGDSGGPAFVKNGHQFVQWGVASAVTSGTCNAQAIHTSLVSYRPWIAKTIEELRQHKITNRLVDISK